MGMQKSKRSYSSKVKWPLIIGFVFVFAFATTYILIARSDTSVTPNNEFVEEQTPAKGNHTQDTEDDTLLSRILPSRTPEESPQPPPPEQKILSGGTHVFQTFNNCGPASLSMVLSYFDQHITQDSLGRELRPYQNAQGNNDDKSVTLQEIASKAEELGYVAYHRPAGTMELVQQFIAKDIPVITRTWLSPEEDIGHYRVIKGYDMSRRRLTQDDSLQGKNVEYSYDDFTIIWRAFNYEFLVLVPPEKRLEVEHILGEKLDETRAWQHALELAKQQTEKNPNDVYAQFNQLVAHYHLGEYQQTVALYEKIKNQLPPRMLWYQIEPILAYFRIGEYQTVLHMTQAILESQNRAFSELHWLRGKTFEKLDQPSEANAAFELAKLYNTSPYWLENVE